MRTVRLALAGLGTVGCGVVRLIREQHDRIAARTGLDLQIDRALVRQRDKQRDIDLAGVRLVDHAGALCDDGVDVVVEVIGGVDVARDIVLSALRSSKPVVTANKALIAQHAAEVFQAAAQHNVCIGVEATCCAGVPVVAAIRSGLCANRATAIYGIVNGTCNYVLTNMLAMQRPYDQAIADAQRLGYAEADPTTDVDGTDSAHKLAILASLAFDQPVPVEHIAVQGIEHIELADLVAAFDEGYICKLLASAELTDEGLALQVGPGFLPKSHPLAGVGGAFNAVSVYAEPIGHTLYYGRGAGAGPTASAVVADVIDIMSSPPAARRDPWTSHANQPSGLPSGQQIGQPSGRPTGVRFRSIDDQRARYYLRFLLRDQPGAIAGITRIFADGGISLSAITQRDPHDETGGEIVTVIMITHTVQHAALMAALDQTAALQHVAAAPVAVRIIEEHHDNPTMAKA